jgi:hypothetical protein
MSGFRCQRKRQKKEEKKVRRSEGGEDERLGSCGI